MCASREAALQSVLGAVLKKIAGGQLGEPGPNLKKKKRLSIYFWITFCAFTDSFLCIFG